MISNFIFKHHTKDIELMVTKDIKGKPILYIGNSLDGEKVLVKKFLGEWQYKQFLIEAVCLRLAADNESVRKSRDVYVKISKFFKDKSKNEKTFN